MIKLLYLLAGISLKQTVDEFRMLVQRHIQELESQAEEAATFRANPALERGSIDAQTAIAKASHHARVQPRIARLRKRIRIWRIVPLLGYVLLTSGLIMAIVYLESQDPV